MNTTPIKRQFQRMGARMKIQAPAPPRRRWNAAQQEFTLDVQRDQDGEHYVLTVPKGQEQSLEVNVLQVRPSEKHLLLMAKGEVRHPDHRTVVLHEWHRVLMNTEHQSRTMKNVAFVD